VDPKAGNAVQKQSTSTQRKQHQWATFQTPVSKNYKKKELKELKQSKKKK
jgi:hypothetical protein